jgi:tripartite-type tricarboxylate transporter receptor subunit TctC
VAETVPGHEATLWYGVLAPVATPKDVLARLHTAIYAAGRSPRLVGELEAVGQDAGANTPEEFAAYIRKEIAKWSQVVKISGATID